MIASPTSLFPRERIFSRIDAVLTAPIGLVVAGNGSGKSTVLREYLARRGVAHVRLDGAPEHAIPEEFLRAFAAAFAQLAPAMASSVPTAATRFAIGADDDETVRWAREHLAGVTTTVFLDDLHHALSNPRIAAFIKEIVDGTVPHIRWLLAARNADALPVARWMANGLMDLPLDEGDLRITLDELRTAARVTKSPLDDEWLAALHERMQGWPLGLSVALTQGLQPDREPQRDELYDLLLEDALRGRSEQQQDELFATALAGRFDDDLLARLRLPSDTGQKLVATSLVFASSGGFAYHEPFRERLLTRIDALPERRSGALFDAVCDALAEVGRWTESIALLVRKGNPVRIAESLDRRGFDALDRGEATAVREALAAIPDPVVHGYPRVLAMKATLASMDGRHDVSEAWFQMAVSSSSGDTRREIVIHYGLDLVRRKRPDAVDLLEMEAGRPGAAPGWDAVLWALLGTAYVTAHRMNDARNAARIALSRIGSVDNPALQARIFHQAAYVAVNDRDFGAAKDLAERAVQVAEP
ncbi:MAG: hypothetical protein JOZ24_13445, partial [Candidatus Eremiobacteraeota bacterium]|nr:hypothetical protein [Candidatus Eremiobacteraeota bacterium]